MGINKNDTGRVSSKDYTEFCNEYIFSILKETQFGYAFCKRFSINDPILKQYSTFDAAKDHIERFGYINT